MTSIEVTTIVTIIQANGDRSSVSDLKKKTVGDNPRFFANDAEIQMLATSSLLKSQLEHRFGKLPRVTKKSLPKTSSKKKKDS